MITEKKVCEVFGIRTEPLEYKRNPRETAADGYLYAASPKILVALINMVIPMYQMYDPVHSKYVGDYHEEFNKNYAMQIEAIESADSQGRKWPELLKELTR